MFTRKGLILALAALFLVAIIVPGTVMQGTAGGGPAPPPYTLQKVGPEITGPATLVPSSKPNTLNGSMDGTCQGKKVKLTFDFATGKPPESLRPADITSVATDYYLPAGVVKMTGQGCAPASGPGDLMVEEITNLQMVQDNAGKIKKITCQAKLTFVAPQ